MANGSVKGGQFGSSSQRYVGSLGHESEGNTGLIYMRARYMDPVLGRFLSEDPAKDGQNGFVYCGGNSVNRIDYSGKDGSPVLNSMLWELFRCTYTVLSVSLAFAFSAMAIAALFDSSLSTKMGLQFCGAAVVMWSLLMVGHISGLCYNVWEELLGGVGTVVGAWSSLVGSFQATVEGIKEAGEEADAIGIGELKLAIIGLGCQALADLGALFTSYE